MKKKWRLLLLAFLAVLIIIQFFSPEKNINTTAIFFNDISKVYPVPENVKAILKASCYDCHSNNTVYPWYSNIQPVAWWLNDHIQEGKKEINFSEFGSYRIRKQYKKLEEITDQIKDDDMPLSSYTLIHRYAALSKDQKLILTSWAAATRDSIKARFSVDSLIKK